MHLCFVLDLEKETVSIVYIQREKNNDDGLVP